MNKKRIVIVGGGTAGWITAAILVKGLPSSDYKITVIESPDIPTIGVGEATIPPIVNLLSYLELDEDDFLQKIEGTYKYGIHFENWSELGKSYMHAFGEIGQSLDNTDFTKLWLNYRLSLNLPPLNEFSPCAVAAYKNVFSPPRFNMDVKQEQYQPLSKLFYAYQFDAGLLANYLKEYSLALGVTHIYENVSHVNTHDTLGITALKLSDGKSVESDYYVDCSGTKGLLNKQALQCKYESWNRYLPCDRALVVQTKLDNDPFPFTKSIAMSSGWRWQIPLKNRVGNGYVYSSKHISDEDALIEFNDALGKDDRITPVRVIKFATGSLTTPWFKNSIALGLSGSFFEPLESTSIHMTHKYALEFKNALIYGTNMADEAKNFNALFNNDALSIRDFLIAHYCTTKRSDTLFWRDMQNLTIPESLQNHLSEFTRTGHITLPKGSLFPYQSWLQILTGQQYINDDIQLDLLEHNLPSEQAKAFFTNIKSTINTQVSQLPPHLEHLKFNRH
jgi:tryptophan halogenase